MPDLPDDARLLATEVAELMTAYQGQDHTLRQLRDEVKKQERDNEHLRAEVAYRDELIKTYEFAQPQQAADEDERLALYRKAFAQMQAGEDASATIAKVQEKERVLVFTRQEHDEIVRLMDASLDQIARQLTALRKTMALGEDPRRFRPRFLKGSPYQLKTMAGQLQAMRDAARDVQEFLDRARWAWPAWHGA